MKGAQEKGPALFPVQNNIHGFGSRTNQHEQQEPTQGQNEPTFQFQPAQQKQQQEQNISINTNPNLNLAPVYPHERPVGSLCSLQMSTLWTIVIKLIYAVFLFCSAVFQRGDLTFLMDVALRGPPESRVERTKDEPNPMENMFHGFMGMLLGFSIVNIGVVSLVLFGAVKNNLSLVLFWIMFLCLDIMLQVFLIGTASIISSAFPPTSPTTLRESIKMLHLQSVVLLIFNLLCFICAFLFCKQVHVETVRRRQARAGASQWH